jgi:hypothetical protein
MGMGWLLGATAWAQAVPTAFLSMLGVLRTLLQAEDALVQME